MAAIQNRIVLRNGSAVFDFGGHSVLSVEPTESVDIMANKLAIDVATVIVEYERGSGPDLRLLPYGTPLWHYQDDVLARKLYVKEIERQTKVRYKISAISPVGILDKQYHKGGMYTQKPFSELLAEIIEGEVPYTYDEEVGEVEIFGWLPYASKRDNLHQVLFAENISIIKNASGDMHFTFLRTSGDVGTIQESRIFQGSTINYPAVATRIQVTEHSFQYIESNERVTLIDNSDKTPASHKLFVFDTAPVHLGSLSASEGLTVEEAGVNYAIVSGQGVLTGIPYYDKKTTVTRTNSSNGSTYTVSVEDITVITGVNSENVADRMLSYYTSRETVTADVKLNGEKCGRQYSFVDRFGDMVQAYLSRYSARISSFVRAACEFVCGYTPQTFGNNYKYWYDMTSHAFVTVPSGTQLLRFLIVGGGDGGSSGLHGIDDFEDLQAGSKGGEPGSPGNGGLIREVTIRYPAPGTYECFIGTGGTGGAECSSTQARNLGTAGGRSYVITPDGTRYSTEDAAAYRSSNGIKNLFTEDVYAKKGREGVKGGDGGRGSISGNGEPGEDVEWNGITRKGGKGGAGMKFTFTRVEQSILNGGAGGSGAQATADGKDGESVTVRVYADNTDMMADQGYKAYESGGFEQACPAIGLSPIYEVLKNNYGDGGNAGHGGAGRGGFGSANALNMSYTDPYDNKKVFLEMDAREVSPGDVYVSSKGAAGYGGKRGVIVCYSDQPLEVMEEILEAPVLSYVGYDSTNDGFEFSWQSTGAPEYRLWYRISLNGGYSWTAWNYETVTNVMGEIRKTIPCARGNLCQAYVISTGREDVADSDSSNVVTAMEPTSPSYPAPDLTTAPYYIDGDIKALLIAESPGNGIELMTVGKRTSSSEDWNIVAGWMRNREDSYSHAGNYYEYKAAWVEMVNGQAGRIVSLFSTPSSITLPTLATVQSKLLPPINIKAEFREGYYSGNESAAFLTIGTGDTRASHVNIYTIHAGQLPVFQASLDLSSVQSSGLRYFQIATSFREAVPGTSSLYILRNVRDGYEDSNDVLFMVPIPENKLNQPVGSGTLSGSTVTLSWSAVTNAAGYRITRWSSSAWAWVDVASLGSGTLSYQMPYDADAIYNGVLVYRLYALAGTGSGYVSSEPTRVEVAV